MRASHTMYISPEVRSLLVGGLGGEIAATAPVSGGCISSAARIAVGNSNYFIKWGPAQQKSMFVAEEAGLAELRSNCTLLRIPELVGRWQATDGTVVLVTEWIETGPFDQSSWSRLGEGLAELHLTASGVSGDSFGFRLDNYIGATRQLNAPHESWPEFFCDYRLQPQIEWARAEGVWENDWDGLMDCVFERARSLLPESPARSLVHGDLWSGNVLCDDSRRPVLIDPAVYIAHSEVDLAMSELFGGFGEPFYDAYFSERPKSPQYPRRRPIYNLYHMLNHLNLFGRSYSAGVDSVLRQICR